MSGSDIVNVGLSQIADDKLAELKEMGVFADKIDGYRFAVSLAIAHGVAPGDLPSKRANLYNVGSLDPDQSMRRAVEALVADQMHDTTTYRYIERLADWGVTELHAQAKAGEINFLNILDQAAEKA